MHLVKSSIPAPSQSQPKLLGQAPNSRAVLAFFFNSRHIQLLSAWFLNHNPFGSCIFTLSVAGSNRYLHCIKHQSKWSILWFQTFFQRTVYNDQFLAHKTLICCILSITGTLK
jgi:hypothetical protein